MEPEEIQPGMVVRLRAYQDEIITRRVVEIGSWRGSCVLHITSEQEYQAARREQREPMTVGFKFEYLVDVVSRGDARGRGAAGEGAGE